MNNTNCHEYRFSYALIGLAGAINGMVDALVYDFTTKFFISNAVNILIFFWITYEMLVMNRPRRPFTASAILIGCGLMGYVSLWHFAWMFTGILVGLRFEKMLWLAPNIYVDFTQYTAVCLLMLSLYLAVGLLINFNERALHLYC